MARVDEKGKRFEFLVGRIDEAIVAGYYVEAMALTYTLMEERTYSLLDKLNINYKNKDKLYQCLCYLEKHINERTIMVNTARMNSGGLIDWLKEELIDSKLIENINLWRIKRNDITHDLAKQAIDYCSIEKYAIQGNTYFRQYTSIIMKLKKILKT